MPQSEVLERIDKGCPPPSEGTRFTLINYARQNLVYAFRAGEAAKHPYPRFSSLIHEVFELLIRRTDIYMVVRGICRIEVE